MDTTDYEDWSQSAMVELSVAKVLCVYGIYHVCHPSPYRHTIVGFFSRAIACIILPSSHAATLVYPRLASAASISASSHSASTNYSFVRSFVLSRLAVSYPVPHHRPSLGLIRHYLLFARRSLSCTLSVVIVLLQARLQSCLWSYISRVQTTLNRKIS